jgi:hypothetical protein
MVFIAHEYEEKRCTKKSFSNHTQSIFISSMVAFRTVWQNDADLARDQADAPSSEAGALPRTFLKHRHAQYIP